MSRKKTILICDDDSIFHLAVKHALGGKFDFRSAYHSDEALAILRNHPIDAVLLDINMRTPDEGLRAIPRLLEQDPGLAIVMSSGLSDFATVREAMRLGALDYVPKDFNPNELELVVKRVLERRSLAQSKGQRDFEIAGEQRRRVLVGESPAIERLRRMIERVRGASANVLIYGETGTGKEVVARLLRKPLGDGSLEPFVAVDSATIQSSTAESILFGHEKGAFTGADRQTRGVFEEADGGVVYFDELANMSLDIQAKLLRVIQEKEVTRIGSSKVIPLEFRVICATNQRLEDLIAQGRFKDDLYQRLNVLPIELPPLRERREDIPLLADHFIRAQPRGSRMRFNESALAALRAYAWPGNVRELGNLISFLATMVDGDEIDVSDLPRKFREAPTAGVVLAGAGVTAGAPADAAAEGSPTSADFYAAVERYEKELLAREYASFTGSVAKLALRLGMDRSHLYYKLKKYGIHALSE